VIEARALKGRVCAAASKQPPPRGAARDLVRHVHLTLGADASVPGDAPSPVENVK